jgi:Niemann-Pick C1 protein
MALKFDDRGQLETLFFQLGEEEGNGLSKICFAPLLAAGDEATVENCAVQSVWGWLQNEQTLPDNYIDIMMKCIQ